MTENEAIERIKYRMHTVEQVSGENGMEDLEMAIKALEEIQRWHTSVVNPNIKNEFANRSTQICVNCDHKDEYIEELEAEVEEYRAIGTPEELQKAEKEENILKFYYCDSEDSYLIGLRVGNFYYAHYLDGSWVFDMSRYLPWGKHVKQESTAWKEHTFPSEPREINFSEWLKGFVKKKCGGTPEECKKSVAVCKAMIARKITPENMEEYMKFEDECVKNGFTFDSLLKAIIDFIDSQPTAYDPDKVVEQLEERTAFLKDCTKYGNKAADQQSKSYDTMMMYEVMDLVDDLLEIVKAGVSDGN